jgi:hypothetical protein
MTTARQLGVQADASSGALAAPKGKLIGYLRIKGLKGEAARPLTLDA